MKKNIVISAWILVCILTSCSKIEEIKSSERPRLVVGVVVDQMRADYLYRFEQNFGENGFKKLMSEGFNNKNVHYNYIPTATAPGHATIFTGTTPSNHGIISNHWYDRDKGRMIYSLEDSKYRNVTSDGIIDEPKQSSRVNRARSPERLMTTTITDELKLSTNYQSKVIGLSLKDRGAILPGGHLADYALWYDNEDGEFISSSYYLKKLPQWLDVFNSRKLSDSLLNLTWEPLVSIKNYTRSGDDDSPQERIFNGKDRSAFPYNLAALRDINGDFELLPYTPFGNTLLTTLAIQTIKSEQMGQSDVPDFLTISYSSTDLIGHDFGIRSKELEDTYVRLDHEIAILLEFLDTEIGKDNYLLFLTADHGASDNPEYLNQNNMLGKFFNPFEIKEDLNECLEEKYGEKELILYADKTQLYLSEQAIAIENISELIMECLKDVDGLRQLIFTNTINTTSNESKISSFVKNNYYSQRSGSAFWQFEPGWMSKRKYGTTHSTYYNDDTHVPMLWYGWSIEKGESSQYYPITSAAPTLAMMLNIPLPDCSEQTVFNHRVK